MGEKTKEEIRKSIALCKKLLSNIGRDDLKSKFTVILFLVHLSEYVSSVYVSSEIKRLPGRYRTGPSSIRSHKELPTQVTEGLASIVELRNYLVHASALTYDLNYVLNCIFSLQDIDLDLVTDSNLRCYLDMLQYINQNELKYFIKNYYSMEGYIEPSSEDFVSNESVDSLLSKFNNYVHGKKTC